MAVEWYAFLGVGAIAGFLAGLLGVGGGLIIVPVLAALLVMKAPDHAMHMALATSLASMLLTGLSSVLAHQRRGAVRWSIVFKISGGLALGAMLAASIVNHIPTQGLSLIFGLFCLLAGWRMALRRQSPTTKAFPSVAVLTALGVGIGTLSTLVGIGGGSLTVPYLSARGLDIRVAVGTAAACGMPIAIVGSIGFMLAGQLRNLPTQSLGFIYLPALFGITLASVVFAPLGAHMAHRVRRTSLRRSFGCALILLGAYVAVRGLR